MTQGRACFICGAGRGGGQGWRGVVAGVSEAAMPKVGGDGGEEGGSVGGCVDGVERTRTVTSENDGPAGKSLHRETKTIKFDGAIIIDTELTNRDEIFYNLGN